MLLNNNINIFQKICWDYCHAIYLLFLTCVACYKVAGDIQGSLFLISWKLFFHNDGHSVICNRSYRYIGQGWMLRSRSSVFSQRSRLSKGQKLTLHFFYCSSNFLPLNRCYSELGKCGFFPGYRVRYKQTFTVITSWCNVIHNRMTNVFDILPLISQSFNCKSLFVPQD